MGPCAAQDASRTPPNTKVTDSEEFVTSCVSVP